MSRRLLVIGPREARLLFRYFASVDQCLAARFSLGFPPDEEHLTSLLVELLDERGSKMHPLQFTLSQLNEGLKACNPLLGIDLSIKTNKYNRYQESSFTQADLGVILDYRDHINNDLSFVKGVLFQAKRLFPNSANKYTVQSDYQAYRDEQHKKFKTIDESYPRGETERDFREERYMHHRGSAGHNCYYLMYNPPMGSFEKDDFERITHSQLLQDSSSIFDYVHGMHLYNQLLGQDSNQNFSDIAALVFDVHEVEPRETGGQSTGKIPKTPSFGQFLEKCNFRQSSLPWFLVFDFLLGPAGTTSSQFVNLVRTGGSSKVQGDAEIELLAPRYSLILRIEAGRNPDLPRN